MKRKKRDLVAIAVILACLVLFHGHTARASDRRFLGEIRDNGALFQEGFKRCDRFVDGWMAYADREGPIKTLFTGQRINKSNWQPRNSAADNYAFMVLTTSFTDLEQYTGDMLTILKNEKQYASIGVMPVDFDFVKDKKTGGIDVFGASEYVKDGLMAITEWLGKDNPWFDRMIEIQDTMWTQHATHQTAFGLPMLSTNTEVNGEQLQMLPRLYWMTGERKYLDWAIRLGDHYLLGGHHRTDDFTELRFRDHGNEIVSGLTELYATLKYADTQKATEYQPHIHRMLDRALAVGRNSHGFFYNSVNPKTGKVVKSGLADNFGYVLNAYYTVYLLDGISAYRDAVLQVLENLPKYYMDNAFGEAMDGRADAIEGTLNLWNREPVAETTVWINDTMLDLWKQQRADGVISGVYPDGNFARTTILYCLWKSKGITIEPWSAAVEVGADYDSSGQLIVSVGASADWEGRLVFDKPRHDQIINLPLDYPRINQFPEWFSAKLNRTYQVTNAALGSQQTYSGLALQGGVHMKLKAGTFKFLQVMEEE